MNAFYHGNETDIDFKYVNKYLKDSIIDILTMLNDYENDFYVLPLELFDDKDNDEYHKLLIDAANNVIIQMFNTPYKSIEDLYSNNKTYEDVENSLIPSIKDQLIFSDYNDLKCNSLREKILKYLKINSGMKFLDRNNEIETMR